METVEREGELDNSQEGRVGGRVHLKYYYTGDHHQEEDKAGRPVLGVVLKALQENLPTHIIKINSPAEKLH